MRPPWARERPVPPEALATSVRSLAGAIRVGVPPGAALVAWPAQAGDALPVVAAVARRVALGVPPTVALRPLRPVARCFALHRSCGGSLPVLLERAAETIERDAAAARTARAATSGARLSARLVAGLPLAFVPFTGAPLRADAAGAVLLGAGVALAGAGLWWIGRLLPVAPDGDDGAASLADDVAVALRGGVGLGPALEAAATHPPPDLEGALVRCRRRVRLGEHWVDSLRNEGGALEAVGEVIARSRAWGVPAAAPLTEWAALRRAQVRTDMQAALRRAPVLMVVPLTVCVLPAFVLLAFGPLLLGMRS